MLKRLFIIFFIIAVTISYALYQKGSLESHIGSDVGSVLSRLPAVEFETLDGHAFKVEDYLKNNSVELLVVHYWGTWCGPCEAELPDLLSFIKRFEGKPGVKFLLVAVNDDVVKVKKHIKELNLPEGAITWLLDNKNAHRDQFGTTRVPETYVFSSDKVTLRKYVGPQQWNNTLYFQTFGELLQISTHKL